MALDFFAGCLGGIAGIVVGHPFDTVKVILQTQKHTTQARSHTAYRCLHSLMKADGFRGIYKGVVTPVFGSIVINAAIFGIYGNVERQLKASNVIYPYLFAGGIAGLVQSPLTNIIDLIKIRYQITPLKVSSKNSIYEFVKHIYETDGLRKGLLKGNGITAIREVPSYTIYFLTYELLTNTSSSDVPISTARMLIAGGLAGQASWLFTYPIDVIKSRIQSDYSGKYKGIIDCAKQSYKVDGYGIFFKGLSVSLVRAFPSNAVCFAIVNWTFRTHEYFTRISDAESTDSSDQIESKIKVPSSDNFRICDVNPQSNLHLAC